MSIIETKQAKAGDVVERDGKPVTPGAVPAERAHALCAAAAKATFEYRRELLLFSDVLAPEPWDLVKVGKVRDSAANAMLDIAKLDPEGLVKAVLSACANSVERVGLYNLGLALLPEEPATDEGNAPGN